LVISPNAAEVWLANLKSKPNPRSKACGAGAAARFAFPFLWAIVSRT